MLYSPHWAGGEMVSAPGLGPGPARGGGSSPLLPTRLSTEEVGTGIDVLNTARVHRVIELEGIDDEIKHAVD